MICFWLSLQLILGSVGLPIIEHYCEMSGKSNIFIIAEKKCCCDISAANFSKLIDTDDTNHLENTKDDCCTTETSYEKANFEAISIQKTVFDFGHLVAILPSPISFKNFTKKSFFTTFQVFYFADLPPPNWKLGKLFIVFIQVFRW